MWASKRNLWWELSLHSSSNQILIFVPLIWALIKSYLWTKSQQCIGIFQVHSLVFNYSTSFSLFFLENFFLFFVKKLFTNWSPLIHESESSNSRTGHPIHELEMYTPHRTRFVGTTESRIANPEPESRIERTVNPVTMAGGLVVEANKIAKVNLMPIFKKNYADFLWVDFLFIFLLHRVL